MKMKVAVCDGCGRPEGLRGGELACPCWRAHNREATIPERLQARTVRAGQLYDKLQEKARG